MTFDFGHYQNVLIMHNRMFCFDSNAVTEKLSLVHFYVANFYVIIGRRLYVLNVLKVLVKLDEPTVFIAGNTAAK